MTAFQWDPDHADYAGTGVPRNMTTMPAFMKRAGYKVGMTCIHPARAAFRMRC